MRPDGDLLLVPSRDFRFLRDEELVRLLVLHRRRSDHARAKEAWDQLVENIYDRVRSRVAAWRWKGQDVTIDRPDVDDVTQMALIRLGALLESFEGEVLPQFRAFAFTCADFTCMDHARKAMRIDMHSAGSMQEEVEGDEDSYSRLEAELGRVAEGAAEREDEIREARDLVAHGLPLVPSADQRAVLQMTLEGVPADEIAERLDTSLDNVYQLRRRGLRKLKEVLGDGLL